MGYTRRMSRELPEPERPTPELVIPDGWKKATLGAPVPVVRCTYIFPDSHDRPGEQCRRWSVRGALVCPKHGGRLDNVEKHAAAMVEAARLRLTGAVPDAVEWLIDLAEGASSEAVRLKATTEVLDRGGVRGGSDVNISVSETSVNPADVLRERLETLRKRNEEAQMAEARIIEGVTVDTPVPDGAPAPSDSDASEE